ncbi:hypothetical protein HFO15_33685 [Rhizobium laguerreae]|uniref:hypothetical protein n=1 Tax=Rhizobium laguerreae TaxID=1076926 RepID=UPI001C92059F|nr:hypothetical protein [Rhizobium laguerreae]MBY3095461.1 hypothetical protein [Rhizobium laguerreae]MBY3129897.1 hypothetical protein [Rhizobium laguerreae]MBY3143061.1 hypothetical protein [Rhizobium laguerreae]MBY3157908.1 hypothetical protein [Rhizobium laguerreae]MBY3205743.1 hypothetical protein [Rhizobium laguerreae]
MRKRALVAAGLSAIVVLLASCGGTHDPAMIASERQAKSTELLNARKQKGALILARFVYPGLFGPVRCPGDIRLRKLVDGAPDKVAAPVSFWTAYRWLLPEQKKPADMKGNILNPVGDAKDYARAFHPIEPGTYIVTYASCELSSPNGTLKLEAGGDHGGLFNYISALEGASTITIGEGQIVDAGYFRVHGTRTHPVVVGQEASAAEREVMREVLPGTYSSITFKKFGE